VGLDRFNADFKIFEIGGERRRNIALSEDQDGIKGMKNVLFMLVKNLQNAMSDTPATRRWLIGMSAVLVALGWMIPESQVRADRARTSQPISNVQPTAEPMALEVNEVATVELTDQEFAVQQEIRSLFGDVTKQPESTFLPEGAKRVRYVSLEDQRVFSDRVFPDSFVFNLFHDVNFLAVATAIDVADSGAIRVTGELFGIPGSHFTLSRDGGTVSVIIYDPDQGYYDIQYQGAGEFRIIESDTDEVPVCRSLPTDPLPVIGSSDLLAVARVSDAAPAGLKAATWASRLE
jgi:hypothetical protein